MPEPFAAGSVPTQSRICSPLNFPSVISNVTTIWLLPLPETPASAAMIAIG
jgi:hypothetical protein